MAKVKQYTRDHKGRQITGGVTKRYNYERPQTLEDGEVSIPSPVDAFGYQIIDDETGEVLASRGNWLQAVEQVGSVNHYAEEPGEPLIVDFSKARDLKERAKALLGVQSVAGIYGGEADDTDAFNALDDIDDNEVDDFNEAMSKTPYACDDKGVSNYEHALIKDESELNHFREYMALKDNPLFNKLAKMSDDELRALGVQIDAVSSQPQGATGELQDPPADNNAN